MAAAGDTREAYCPSHAICNKGDPTMFAVAVRNNSGDCHSRHGMHRIEAAGVKRVVIAAEEAICVRAVACVLQGLPSAADAFKSEVEQETIRERFARKQRGALRVGILSE